MRTDGESFSPDPLPLSYKITIVASVSLILLLGLFYFSLRNQQVKSGFRVYSSGRCVQGATAAFAVVQFDNIARKDLPCSVESIRVEQGGKEQVQETPQLPRSIPAVALLDTSDLSPGRATVHLSVVGWNGENREISFDLEVERASEQPASFILAPPLDAPLHLSPDTAVHLKGRQVRLDLTIAGEGLVEGISNPLYLRAYIEGGGPVDVEPIYTLGGSEPVSAARTGRLGISRLDITPSGPTQKLSIELPLEGATLSWEEMVAPDRLAQLNVRPSSDPGKVNVQLLTSNESQEFHCILWQGRSALDVKPVVSRENKAEFTMDVPGPGLYWVTCGELADTGGSFQAFAPVLLGVDPVPFLRRMLEHAAPDSFFSFWPPPERLTTQEQKLAIDYLLARMVPEGLLYAQIVNTYFSDAEALRERSGRIRDRVLLLIGMVGLGLVLWAIGVTIRQHVVMARSFRALQEKEDVGEELSRDGITREKSYVPAVLVLLSVLANLAALVFLLRLVFF